MDGNVWEWSATKVARTIASGSLSAREALDTVLARVDSVNVAVNAITDDLREEAGAAALAADERQAKGLPLGCLHGVPMTIKSNVAQRGTPTSNGVVAFTVSIAQEDAPVVANLRRSGAILFGRTNVPAFSWRWFTDNDLHGMTINPRDPSVTSGGSSGGAAAAIAVGMGPLAHGSDLAGSIRHPAACCGVFGLKPSLGRVANFDPGAPDRPMLSQLMVTQGPLARNVDDLILGLEGMRGADYRDVWQAGEGPQSTSSKGRIVALKPSAGSADPIVEAAMEAAAERMGSQGYRVDWAEMPGADRLMTVYQGLLAEAGMGLLQRIAEHGDAKVKRVAGFLETIGGTADLRSYVSALSTRSTLVREWRAWLQTYDVILAPVSWRTPFALDADQESWEAMRDIAVSLLPTMAANILGLPALAFPGASAGVPIGLQLIGAPFQERLLADIARGCSDPAPLALAG